MKKTLLILLAGITFSATSQIAVTEFMNNPIANDTYHEWIELYNYSTNSINLKKWSITDEGIDSVQITATDLIMQPGTYLILALDKDSMEANWFGGVPNSSVVDYDSYALGNSADEIVLKDSTGTIVWQVAYANDDVPGVATFLSYSHDFSSPLTVWGNSMVPGVDRDSLDPISSTIGYEGDTTLDTRNLSSALGDLQGSPLAGNYTPSGSTSISAINSKKGIKIYPNPTTTGEINFSEKVTGVVLDLTGKTVLSFTKQNKVEVNTLNEGVYFVVTNNYGTHKFIKN